MRVCYLGLVVGVIIMMLLPGVVLAQPVIPHSVEGRTDCLMCHETGLVGAPRIPADHSGRGNATCTLCHQVAARTPAPVVTPTPTPRPAVTPVVAPREPPQKPNQVPATGDETPIILAVLGGLLLAGVGWGLRGRWATS